MRSTFFLALLLLFIIAAPVNCGPLPSNEADELVQDGGSGGLEVAEEHGNDGVKLVRPGYAELVISGNSLVVGVDIKECEGKVLFCYAAKSGKISRTAEGLCPTWSGFCGFQLIGTTNEAGVKYIQFTLGTLYTKGDLHDCENNIKMQYQHAQYCKDANRMPIGDASCGAAISQEDGRIGIHVSDAKCDVFIRNAKIYTPPTTTLVPSTAPPSIATTIVKHEKADEASIWPWIVLGVGIGLILIGILIGIFLCWFNDWCMFKKKTADTLPPPRPVESIVSTTMEAKADDKIEKEYEKIKAEHPELKEVISKKSKKASRLPPPPPSAEPSKKASLPSPVKKEKKAKGMKAKTPPTAVAPSKKGLKEKKVAPASPGKKSVEKKAVRAPSAEKKVPKESTKTEGQPCSTEAYSPPFCLMPVRAPSPPVNPNDPNNVNINRKPGQKGHLKNSLELPSYSGGRPVPPSESIQQEMKKNAAAEKAREAERWKKEREERKKKNKK